VIRIIFLFFSIASAGFGVWIFKVVEDASKVQNTKSYTGSDISTKQVLFAKVSIPFATKISRNQLQWVTMLEASITPDHLIKDKNDKIIDKIDGLFTKTIIFPGDPITKLKLSEKSQWGLSSILPAGSRAVAVRISASNTAGGFIRPGHRVDVLSTVTGVDKGGLKKAETSVLLQNILVLAIDQATDFEKNPKNRKATATIGKTATLQVKPREAEELISAETKGSISLALRAWGDKYEDQKKTEKNVGDFKKDLKSITIIKGNSIEIKGSYKK